VIDAISESGAEIVVGRADVTEEREVAAVLENIARSMPPLRGVIHAAMVLDDALLHQFDDDRMRTAMAPKASGAWILHTQTLHLPLDMFVMFSSFSSIVGTTRQANYVAGNAFLDALAHHRRALGLPALTINWGVVGGVGYVAQNADLGQKLEQFGFKSLPVQQILNIFGVLLQEKAVEVGVGHMNWQQLAKMHMIGSSPRFTYLVKPVLTDDVGSAGAWLIDALMAVEPAERQNFLENHIREQLARVLGTSPSKVDVDRPLINLGLDSLMAVEIGNRMQSELGVSIPPVKFMEGLTVSGMAQYLVEQLTCDRTVAAGPAVKQPEVKPAEPVPVRFNVASAGSDGSTLEHAVEDGPAGTALAANGPELDKLKAAVEYLSDREVDSLLKRMAEDEEAFAGDDEGSR
jgi:acyl carrier protein